MRNGHENGHVLPAREKIPWSPPSPAPCFLSLAACYTH